MKDTLARLWQPHIVIAASALVALASVGVVYVMTTRQPQALYVNPAIASIVQQVDAPGTVKAAENVDLSFQTGGRIARISAPVGSSVAAGQTLAALDSADLQAQVAEAKAALDVQQATLAGLQAGTRSQDIAVSQAAVTGAQSTLAQDKQAVVQAAQTSYQKAGDAIYNDVDQFINAPLSSTPTLALTLSNTQLETSIGSERPGIEQVLAQWKATLDALPADSTAVETKSLASQVRSYESQVSDYLNLVAQGLSVALPSASYSASTISGYQSDVSTGRGNLSTAETALDTADTAEQAAEAALATAQSQLSLKQAGATPQAIQAQQAQVEVAQANLAQTQANLAKSVITAPISGVITVNNAHIGETVSSGEALISMISSGTFQMESYVSEADLAKVAPGQMASISLDAYAGQTFPAHVISIDPAATMQNGVAAYKVTLQFDAADPRIKAGLSGNANITTQSKNNVLSIPTSAVITRGTSQYVIKKTPQGDVLSPVTTGISSASGTTEVLSGLTESDSIRTFGSQ